MNKEKIGARNNIGNWSGIARLAMMVGMVVGGGGCANVHEYVDLSSGQQAAVVIGQPDLISVAPNQGGNPAANTLHYPQSATAVNGRLLIADSQNNRVLGYNSIPIANNAKADFVVPQDNMTENAVEDPHSLVPKLFAPRKAHEFHEFLNDERLLVADPGHSRVLTWPKESHWALPPDPPLFPPRLPNAVVGQQNGTSNASACSQAGLGRELSSQVAGGKLFVADGSNHRVLIWNSTPTGYGDPADVVLGQADFTTCLANAGGGVSASSLRGPADVWSDGTRLIVADTVNNRVLIWSSIPTTNATAADIVVGQADFASASHGLSAFNFWRPHAVGSNGVQLFVGDSVNHRVMVFNRIPTTNGAAADVVIGQPDFSTTAPLGIDPMGVFPYHNLLFVSDAENNRVLIFRGRRPYITDPYPSAIQ